MDVEARIYYEESENVAKMDELENIYILYIEYLYIYRIFIYISYRTSSPTSNIVSYEMEVLRREIEASLIKGVAAAI